MRISDAELKKVVDGQTATPSQSETEISRGIGSDIEQQAIVREEEMVKAVTDSVMVMPDREEMIADLKQRIEAGTYKPSSDEIVDGMIRRAIADRMR